ncbi:MAG: glycosyltransferase family 4 protein [Mucilaginibacter sp.]
MADKIEANIFVSKYFNSGYFNKILNIIEAFTRQNKDVNHITGEVHFLNLLMHKKSVVLTIHDCGMVYRKKGLEKAIIKWLYLTAPVKSSRIVTTVSESTKKEIVNYTNCDPGKIHVIPVSVNPIYQPCPKVFNNDKPVILHIGTSYNKNLMRLIEAIKDINCRLTIIGILTSEQQEALHKYRIEFINEFNISNEQLKEKYEECDILSFVSTFEGFGMPIIEANMIERVVITSNIFSMPEIANNAAFFVDPHDVNDIRTGITRIINDDLLRDELINNGKINRCRFDGNTIAEQYFTLYSQIYNEQYH